MSEMSYFLLSENIIDFFQVFNFLHIFCLLQIVFCLLFVLFLCLSSQRFSANICIFLTGCLYLLVRVNISSKLPSLWMAFIFWWVHQRRPDLTVLLGDLHVSVSAGFSHWLISFSGEEFFNLYREMGVVESLVLCNPRH